uniref:Uncharacterized protein n=1 Tax=Photinus pyralis TaxID=7054 RepID=A0A1Y1MEX1_PHOPY
METEPWARGDRDAVGNTEVCKILPPPMSWKFCSNLHFHCQRLYGDGAVGHQVIVMLLEMCEEMCHLVLGKGYRAFAFYYLPKMKFATTTLERNTRASGMLPPPLSHGNFVAIVPLYCQRIYGDGSVRHRVIALLLEMCNFSILRKGYYAFITTLERNTRVCEILPLPLSH